jgi:hypothetical protein
VKKVSIKKFRRSIRKQHWIHLFIQDPHKNLTKKRRNPKKNWIFVDLPERASRPHPRLAPAAAFSGQRRVREDSGGAMPPSDEDSALSRVQQAAQV